MKQEDKKKRIRYLTRRKNKFLRLVSQLDPQRRSCHTFSPTGAASFIAAGSYHACIFVEFDGPERERRVLRIPLKAPDDEHMSLVEESMTGEILAMRVVSAKTTIPVPTVYCFDLTKKNAIKSPFILLSYHKGRSLHGMVDDPLLNKKIYVQVVKIWIQLSHLTFPAIGSLGLPDDLKGRLLDCEISDICVCSRPLTHEIIRQELEGHEPGTIISPSTVYTDTLDLVDDLLLISRNQFAKSGNLGLDWREVSLELYARSLFGNMYKTLRHADDGVFCLFHGDITLHPSNILFDDEFNIVAVIDWTESWVMPVELVCPPTWLIVNYDVMMRNTDVFNILAVPFPHAGPSDPTTDRNYSAETGMAIALLYPIYIAEVFFSTLRATPSLWGSSESYDDFFDDVVDPAAAYLKSLVDVVFIIGMAKRQVAFWHKEDPSKERSFQDAELNWFLQPCPGCRDCTGRCDLYRLRASRAAAACWRKMSRAVGCSPSAQDKGGERE